MSDMIKYLKEVKKKKGFKSDRELGRVLKLSPMAAHQFMKNLAVPSDETCEKIAALSGDPLEKVLMIAQASRAKKPKYRKVYQGILQKIAMLAIVVFPLSFWVYIILSLPSINLLSGSIFSFFPETYNISYATFNL